MTDIIQYAPIPMEMQRFFASNPTPKAIMAFEEPALLKVRMQQLLAKRSEGTLTTVEAAEFEQLIEAEHLLRRMKAEAEMLLSMVV